MRSLSKSYFGIISATESHAAFSISVVQGDEIREVDRFEFAKRCRLVAGGIAAAGVKPRDIVLIFLSHGDNLLPVFFGIQWAGGIPSYMPPLSPRQDLKCYLKSHSDLIEHINPALVIADPEVSSLLICPKTTKVLTLAELLSDHASEARDPSPVDVEDIALLQHSSGTTGLKKGVALTYRAILAQIESYRSALQIQGNETILTWLPVYHDMGLIACSVMPFVLGLPIVSIDPFEWLLDPIKLLDLASRATEPLIWLPNFAFHHLVRHAKRIAPDTKLDKVKAFINCSEPCKAATFDLFHETFAPQGVEMRQLQTCYAMAENVFAVTQSTPGRFVRRLAWSDKKSDSGLDFSDSPFSKLNLSDFLSCGQAIPDVEIKILAQNGAVAPDGGAGEVCIRGSSLFESYYLQPELTTSRVHEGWYCTRDIGFMQDGELFICGRIEDLIIVAGRNLYAHDIEMCITGIDGVRPGRSVAFGVSNVLTGTEDLVVLVEAVAKGADQKRIQRDIRARISAQILVTPSAVVVLSPDTLVKTTSGKVSRGENRRRYLASTLDAWASARSEKA
jgi:fatty-acyl-CoA synthase